MSYFQLLKGIFLVSGKYPIGETAAYTDIEKVKKSRKCILEPEHYHMDQPLFHEVILRSDPGSF